MDKISNKEILRRMNEDEMCLCRSIQKQKMTFTVHVLRGSSGEDALQILEGKLEVTRAQGMPRLWLDDIKQCTSVVTVNRTETETAVFCYLQASSSPRCFRPKMARCYVFLFFSLPTLGLLSFTFFMMILLDILP